MKKLLACCLALVLAVGTVTPALAEGSAAQDIPIINNIIRIIQEMKQ